MTTPLDRSLRPDILTEFASRLLASGFSSVGLLIDGSELLLQGMVPSFEDKLQIEIEAHHATGLCVRNCLRVAVDPMDGS